MELPAIPNVVDIFAPIVAVRPRDVLAILKVKGAHITKLDDTRGLLEAFAFLQLLELLRQLHNDPVTDRCSHKWGKFFSGHEVFSRGGPSKSQRKKRQTKINCFFQGREFRCGLSLFGARTTNYGKYGKTKNKKGVWVLWVKVSVCHEWFTISNQHFIVRDEDHLMYVPVLFVL